eukprot:jgi/Psemu1/296069/fgenesh1_pm.121_\
MSVSKLFESGKRPNILVIITDQERAIQHWPESFSKDHLPSMERLKKHGLDFNHHYTNTCMCSPSRSTLLTSQFPIKTGVTRTGSPGPPRALPTDIPNLATVMKQAGYPKVEWHGKWHVGNTPADYGFEGWQPPDAGNYLSVNETLGGGTPDNDGRFLNNLCKSLEKYHEQNKQKGDDGVEQQEGEPFCIVASFVNPHDVYVAQHGPAMGYTKDDFNKLEVPLPPNLMEDPDKNNKPRSQAQMSLRYVTFESSHQEYINFYAHLHTVVDTQIGELLDQVDRLGFTDSTLILRTADHGEQGLSHSLVEKFYNCYQESLRIPLVVSNPIAFPEPRSTDALSSHLDIVPTLAGLLRNNQSESFQGTDLTQVLDNPQIKTTSIGKNNDTNGTIIGIQPRIHFTYDDIPCPGAPSTIRCVHKGTIKYAVYFTPDGRDADWELYDLTTDPLENKNLAGNPEYEKLQKEMEQELYDTMVEMETLPTNFQWPPSATPFSQGFNHPPKKAIEEPSTEGDEEEEEKSTLGSYEFSDEGEFVRILLSMEDVGAKCSEHDIHLEWSERSVSLILEKYLPKDAPVKFSFKKLTAEITDAKHEVEEHKVVLVLSKKDSTVEWKSINFTAEWASF